MLSKLFFDMDGCLRELDLAMIHVCERINDFDPSYTNSITATRPLLNPMDFALPEDELYCLTRCTTILSSERKARWLEHFYGNRIKLIPLVYEFSTNGGDTWGQVYCDVVGKAKYDILVDNKADIYLDDDPGIIRVMRRLAEKDGITSIKFIKYGCWIEEYQPLKKEVSVYK